jgi:peptide/nickel transport system substrate-binding protein
MNVGAVRTERRSISALTARDLAIALWLLLEVVACGPGATRGRSGPTTLTIGYGLATTSSPQFGMQMAARLIASEGLAKFDREGRPQPGLAESWSQSPDGLSWRIRLRPSVRFHDGKLLDVGTVVDLLRQQFPRQMGPAAADVSEITAVGDRDVLIRLNARSAFVPEALETLVEKPKQPDIGTGPFRIVSSSSNGLEMVANQQYYLGVPRIDRIVFKPYASLRAAWADMMRGQVDALYEVGPDAVDLLRPASNVRVFEYPQNYAYIVLLNVDRPQFMDKRIRYALNMAIDRDKLIADIFQGHGTPAGGPVWPEHWAYDRNLPAFRYSAPTAAKTFGSVSSGHDVRHSGRGDLHFTCLFADAALERLALGVQQQLQPFGVDMNPELLSIDEFTKRATNGNFDALLLDAQSAPSLLRVYQWWHSGAPFNFGGFRGDAVDRSLDSIRHAADDAAYKTGVAALQRAIVEDPPAIFLTWRERARAVSNRFDVVPDPSGNVLKTLHLWSPATGERTASEN